MSQNKELFIAKGKKAGIYICGITPYDVTHLGHAFTYVFFDVLVRYLRHLGYQTTYVQNLTDVDDDLLKKARVSGKDWRTLAEKNTKIFLNDLSWLNLIQPDVFPRATDHIQEMIKIIKQLLKNNSAYANQGNIYFSVEQDKEYGKLSRIPRKKMLPLANERGNNPDDPYKHNPLDFVLWQAAKPGEPSWPSLWGRGRPGWHIECSAISMKYLGKTLAIYGGGSDLIFPHHESSIAQSETAGKKPLARYWLHTAMVRYKGKKMSKSLGNLLLISDLKTRYSANALKIYLLSHHYRAAWEAREEDIKKAENLNELFSKIWRVQSGMGKRFKINGWQKNFYDALNDDINTPLALATLENMANRILHYDKTYNISDAKAFLGKALHILGLEIML